jgi:hypothetical protein
LPRVSARVRFPSIENRCVDFPRFRTRKRTVEPAGTARRESAKEKSRASTRTVYVACGCGVADPASASVATAVTPIARDHGLL